MRLGQTIYPLQDNKFAYVHSTMAIAGGYSLYLPASDVGGYVLVAGVMPCVYLTTPPATGWNEVFTGFMPVNPMYYLSTTSGTNVIHPQLQYSYGQGQPFTGVVWIPPHPHRPYELQVFGVADSQLISTARFGAAFVNNAQWYFVPDDTSNVENSLTQLEQINQAAQSILESLTSTAEQDSVSQAFVSQINDVLDQMDELTEHFNDIVNRPPVQEVLPNTLPPDIIDYQDTVYLQFSEYMTQFFSNQLILSLLLIFAVMGLLAFVLFKR